MFVYRVDFYVVIGHVLLSLSVDKLNWGELKWIIGLGPNLTEGFVEPLTY